MSKDKKPTVQAPVKDASTETKPTVINSDKAFMPKKVGGMSPDAKVTYFATLHSRYGNPANVPEDIKDNTAFISAMNAIADAVAVTIAIEEAVNTDTVFHAIVNKNDKPAYKALAFLTKEYGYEIPEANLLPAPTKEQLEKAGLTEEEGKDKVVIDVDPNKVSKEAKAQIAAEKKVTDSKPADTPTDVKDEKQLAASLLNIFIKGDRPVARAKKAINFYRAYLKLQNKNNADKLKEIEAMTDVTLLESVKNIIGPCPYKDKGISQFLRKCVATAGSPVTAFNLLYRSARNRKTGEMEATDELIAAICRTYVIWSCEATIADANKVIDSEERQLKKLGEKTDKNAEAIDTINKNIESKKNDIEWANGVIDTVVNPESALIDGVIDAYNDDKNENHNLATVIVNDILSTFYPNEDMTKYEKNCVENNARQYAGIITNLFRDPGAQMPDYGYANVLPLVKIDDKNEETKTKEEKPKK